MCICVFVYLTVVNISFDVLGPWSFKKYRIIRFYKVFWAWWRRRRRQPGEPSASLLVEHWAEQAFAKCNNISQQCRAGQVQVLGSPENQVQLLLFAVKYTLLVRHFLTTWICANCNLPQTTSHLPEKQCSCIFSLPTFHFLDALWPWIDGTNGKTTNNNRDRAKNKAVGWAISHRFGFGGLVPFLARELVFTNFREWFVGGWNVRLQWEREEPNCLSAICPEREEPAPWSAACQEMVQAAIHYAGLAPQFRILLSASTGPLL